MHEVANRLFVPNDYDTEQGLGSYFGATTMIINGGLECSDFAEVENEDSQMRISHY